MEPGKRILVANGEKKALKELFNVSYPTVRDALKGKQSTSLSYNIRKSAIERGGVEIESNEIKTSESKDSESCSYE
jgi:hypothetical protein